MKTTCPYNRTPEKDNAPLYLHISYLIMDIARELSEGERIPSEHCLLKKFNCSRSTIRMAIDVLVSKGYLRKIRGIGSVVSKPKLMYSHQDYISFTEQVNGRNLTATTTVKSISRTDDIDYLDKFSSDPNFQLISELLKIERYRSIDGQLAIIENTYLPYSYKKFINIKTVESEGLYSALSSHGLLDDFRAEEKLTPILLSGGMAEEFRREAQSPMMQVERFSQNKLGMFEYTRSIIDTEFFSFFRSIRTS